MPALSVTEAVQRRFAIVEFVREAMKPGVDFGCIPGTPKPTLLKPGAEKLCTLFGLTTRFQIIHSVEDWTGEAHNGEPFFYYLYRCQLWRDERVIAEGDGSCNSFEQKYRWRDAQRVCPHCGKNAIIKGKAEFGGGWLCFVKKGGCGAKFMDGDETIETQPVGRVSNPDVADQVNTIQKMGQKRALVAATLLAVNASEFFTQDEEERVSSTPDMFLTPEPSPVAKTPPLVVISFEPAEQNTTTQSANVQGGKQELHSPSPKLFWEKGPGDEGYSRLTAAQARVLFEEKARTQYGFTDSRGIAHLAVALLGGKPDRWTAEVWQSVTAKPEAQWEAALRIAALATAGT